MNRNPRAFASWTGLSVLVLLVSAGLLGCASSQGSDNPGPYHRYLMRGSIVDVEDEQVVLCIGSAGGATVGQTLTVFRVDKGPRLSTPRYRRIKEGSVRIAEVIDEHFARAQIVSGSAREGWIVDLEPDSNR